MAGLPLGVAAGAIVPQPGEQAAPFCVNVQVTPAPVPLFDPSLVTVAENCGAAFTTTLAEAGDMDTEMGRIVIAARLSAPLLALEVAWRDTPKNLLKQNRPHGPPTGGVKCAGAV